MDKISRTTATIIKTPDGSSCDKNCCDTKNTYIVVNTKYSTISCFRVSRPEIFCSSKKIIPPTIKQWKYKRSFTLFITENPTPFSGKATIIA